jgi:hypothetical protein
MMFSMRSVPKLHLGVIFDKRISRDSGVDAGSNTSTVTLRVVEGDEKESLESGRVKYGHESHGNRTRE